MIIIIIIFQILCLIHQVYGVFNYIIKIFKCQKKFDEKYLKISHIIYIQQYVERNER